VGREGGERARPWSLGMVRGATREVEAASKHNELLNIMGRPGIQAREVQTPMGSP